MYRKAFLLLALGHLTLLSPQLVRGDEYSECKGRCIEDNTACMSEPQASEPTEQTAKEAACTDKLNNCNAACEASRPKNEDVVPQSPEAQPEPPPADTPPQNDMPNRGE